MKNLWKGISIAGIWLSFAIMCFAPEMSGDFAFVGGIGGFILSCVIAHVK